MQSDHVPKLQLKMLGSLPSHLFPCGLVTSEKPQDQLWIISSSPSFSLPLSHPSLQTQIRSRWSSLSALFPLECSSGIDATLVVSSRPMCPWYCHRLTAWPHLVCVLSAFCVSSQEAEPCLIPRVLRHHVRPAQVFAG